MPNLKSDPPSAAPSDAQLLADHVADPNGTAFGRLVQRHGPMVFAVACRRAGNDADAADVTQAVFLALARKARSLDGAYLAGWLLRATDYAVRALRVNSAGAPRVNGRWPCDSPIVTSHRG